MIEIRLKKRLILEEITMRDRFDTNPELGMKPIEETPVLEKSRDPLQSVVRALLAIYNNKENLHRILSIIEERVSKNKKNTGRYGLNFWQIFVLAEFRMGLNLSYDRLHSMVFSDSVLRQILGAEPITEAGFQNRVIFTRNRILNNVHLLTDEDLKKINSIIVNFGHKEVFVVKKKEGLNLKTDSFPVQAEVHFPSDHSLLNDSVRKAGDMIEKILKESNITGWRKLDNWTNTIKNLQRNYAKANTSGGKYKEKRTQETADKYLAKAVAFSKKLNQFVEESYSNKTINPIYITVLKGYISLLDKHIDLFYRRVKLGEKIPHDEKLFSIFEQYAEWLSKGKRNVEIGKNTSITTDQYGLILDYYIMEKETDSQIVIDTKDRILACFTVDSWSFDKGYWSKINYQAFGMDEVKHLVMPKKGKLNKTEKARENTPEFKKYKRNHSAVESSVNEVEHSGLHRCRDKGYAAFKRYVGMGVIAHNLKRIGKELRKQDEIKLKKVA